MFLSNNFLGIPESENTLDGAQVVVLPVPYERTVSYGVGTRNGPAAIIEASRYVELYDDELDEDVAKVGIHTMAPWLPDRMDPEACVEGLEGIVSELLTRPRFVLTLGGEHSIATGPVRAHHARYPGSVRSPLRRPRRPARRVRGGPPLARLRGAPVSRDGPAERARRHPVDLPGGGRVRPREGPPDRVQPEAPADRRVDAGGARTADGKCLRHLRRGLLRRLARSGDGHAGTGRGHLGADPWRSFAASRPRSASSARTWSSTPRCPATAPPTSSWPSSATSSWGIRSFPKRSGSWLSSRRGPAKSLQIKRAGPSGLRTFRPGLRLQGREEM